MNQIDLAVQLESVRSENEKRKRSRTRREARIAPYPSPRERATPSPVRSVINITEYIWIGYSHKVAGLILRFHDLHDLVHRNIPYNLFPATGPENRDFIHNCCRSDAKLQVNAVHRQIT